MIQSLIFHSNTTTVLFKNNLLLSTFFSVNIPALSTVFYITELLRYYNLRSQGCQYDKTDVDKALFTTNSKDLVTVKKHLMGAILQGSCTEQKVSHGFTLD